MMTSLTDEEKRQVQEIAYRNLCESIAYSGEIMTFLQRRLSEGRVEAAAEALPIYCTIRRRNRELLVGRMQELVVEHFLMRFHGISGDYLHNKKGVASHSHSLSYWRSQFSRAAQDPKLLQKVADDAARVFREASKNY
jgi:hypothetical protein